VYGFIGQRALKALLTVLAVLLFVFFGSRLTGDPISMMFPEGLTQQQHDALTHRYGLDRSMLDQFWVYLKNAATGDFGVSITENRPVTTVVFGAAAQTLKLGVWAFLLSSIAGIAIGIAASLKPEGRLSKTLMFLVCAGYSIPGFIVAILLVLIFGYYLQLLPSLGQGGPASYVLPVVALSARPAASVARYVQNSLVDVLAQQYIRTARAKGMGQRIVILKHAFRNALVPLVTVVGMLVIEIISGALFIEVVFSWPGVGKCLIDAVLDKDFPVLQFGVVMLSMVVIVVNLLVDLLYGVIDPRLRKGVAA